MPTNTSYSSMLPKFPDKTRRPGIIHLPAPIATPPRSTSKLPALNSSQKMHHQPSAPFEPGLKANTQLRTPSPGVSPSPRRPPHSNPRRKQKRSGVSNIVTNISEFSASTEPPRSPIAPGSSVVAARVPPPGLVPLSPPPTPANRKANKTSKSKPKGRPANHGRNVSKPQAQTLPVSPPLTPEAPQVCLPITILSRIFTEANLQFSSVAVEAAVFQFDTEGQTVETAQDSSDDSLPLADEDEVIVWKHPQTPISLFPAPLQRAQSTSSRSSSPSEFFNWEDVKNLPRLSPATVAQLKEQYNIHPSKDFLSHTKTETQEPDLLMSLLQSASSSCPPSPGAPVDAAPAYPQASKPIPISRRPGGSHVRAPSVPSFPSSGRIAMMQYREDVAEAFGLDVRDAVAVRRATEAWRAYAGSAFNNSPETERVPAPKFLGRLFH